MGLCRLTTRWNRTAQSESGFGAMLTWGRPRGSPPSREAACPELDFCWGCGYILDRTGHDESGLCQCQEFSIDHGIRTFIYPVTGMARAGCCTGSSWVRSPMLMGLITLALELEA